MNPGSRLRFHWKEADPCCGFASGVSLHSHTSSSQEVLDFIPRIAKSVPFLEVAERAARREYRRVHGKELDYQTMWWTPPLTPVEALELERRQLTSLGLKPMVSLSDHDTIDGVWGLQSMESTRDALVSVEWTLPVDASFVHLGIHNIPGAQARSTMEQLAEYTANPRPNELAGIFAQLSSNPETLTVLNHPLWDEKCIGTARHAAMVETLLRRYSGSIHALELNGLRPWAENRLVVRLGLELGLPLISGGDRHGLEPNANLNVTNAATFPEFVDEIRRHKSSDVLFMPQYRTPLVLRVIDTICDVLRTNRDHGLGWQQWTDRVFRRCDDGLVRSLSTYWNGQMKPPAVIRLFLSAIRLADSKHVRSAMRSALGAKQEMVW